MRASSVIAGLLALIAAMAVLSWAIRPTPATQKSVDGAPLSPTEIENAIEEAAAGGLETETPPTSESSPTVDKHETNPFSLTSSGPPPKAVVDNLTHEFGRLAVGATGTHDFVIRNEGAAPLMLAKGESTCKCTGFSLGLKEIAPGESAVIHLEWKPPHEAPGFTQTAVVWTNDPENPKLELKVEGAVVPVISVVPSGTWSFGMISEGSPSVVKGRIASFLEESFEIKSIESSSEHVQVSYEPIAAEELQRMNALAGYEVTCTVDAAIPVGMFSERIKVLTTLTEAPQMQFTLSGSRAGPFTVIGPGWTQSHQLLRMGRCVAAEGKKVQISYFVAVPKDVEFAFGEPRVTPPVLNVTVKRDESFSAPNGRQRHLVLIEAPPGITPRRWSDDDAIKVTLPSNHPYASSATFNVELQAD